MAQRNVDVTGPLAKDKSEEASDLDESSYSEGDSSTSSEESQDDEPVLKYKRFAKEVVTATCEGPEGTRNIISCIAVHPKVRE